MATQLIPDKPYFPSGGINPDSNGIRIRPEEAIDGVNIDITGSEIRPRFGTISIDPFIAGLPQPTEDVLHYHDFLEPGGSTTVFAFTNRSIYRYTKGAGWTSVVSSLLIGGLRFDQWSTTNFVDIQYGATVIAAGSRYTQPDQAEKLGGNRVLLFFNRSSGVFEKLSINSNFPITEEDLAVQAPVAKLPSRYFQNILFTVLQYEKWAVGSVGGSDYVDVAITITNGGGATPVCAVTMYTDVRGGTFTADFDLAIAADVNITVLVAGSTIEAIQNSVNTHSVASLFLECTEGDSTVPIAMAASEIYAGVSGIVSGALDNNPSLSFDFIKITPALFSIKTEEGTLAICGTEIHEIDGEDCYRMLPVDSRYIAYGDDSYVRVDGTKWQLSFTTNRYGGSDLYADYYYERSIEYHPKVVQVFHNALMFGNTYEDSIYYPWRNRYTFPGDMTLTNDNWYHDLIVNSTGGIRDMWGLETAFYTTLGTYLYVYTDHGILRGAYDPINFITYDEAIHEGVYATRTIQAVEGVQFYLGTNDIYMFNGVERLSLTYDAEMKGTRVKEYLMSILDPIILKNTFAIYDKPRRKYILFIKQRGEVFPTKALCYDIDRKIWTKYQFPATSAALHVSMEVSFNTIDSLVGQIQNLSGTIDELGGSTTNSITLYAMTKKTYLAYAGMITDKTSSVEDTAVSKIHTLITRDFLFRSLEEAERVSLMKFEAYGTSVTVRYSTEYDTLLKDFIAIPGHETFSLTGKYKTYFYNCDTQCDKIRFSFSSIKDFKIRWIQPFSIQTTEITEE